MWNFDTGSLSYNSQMYLAKFTITPDSILASTKTIEETFNSYFCKGLKHNLVLTFNTASYKKVSHEQIGNTTKIASQLLCKTNILYIELHG